MWFALLFVLLAFIFFGMVLFIKLNKGSLKHEILETRLRSIQETQQQLSTQLSGHITLSFDILRKTILDTLETGHQRTQEQLQGMIQRTDQRLQEINQQVEKRLSEGFEKTTLTFQHVLQRLTIIDEAQKKIGEISGHITSLQAILIDKRSRGALGEIQLKQLISNMIPPKHYAMQYTLSTGVRVDCMLFLPPPNGNLAIDSKFPLENYKKMLDASVAEVERKTLIQNFKQDIKKHIQAIESKYIIKNETSDGAIMFIPAESIFSEIHAHHPDLIEYSHRSRVWLASPTTLMAILTTVQAVIKDDITRKQIHIIQTHLTALGEDFKRFQERISNLNKHIRQAHDDVEEVHTSTKKLTERFHKIEKAEFSHSESIEK